MVTGDPKCCIREQQLGADHPSVATSLNNLALLYRSQGKYSEAEPLYLRSLEIRERELGADHPDVATSLNNLAALYKLQGKYSEAEALYLRSLEIRERQLGADHPSVAASLFNLAVLYHNTQRHPQALQSIQRAIQIYEQKLGTEHPDTQNALNWLQIIRAADQIVTQHNHAPKPNLADAIAEIQKLLDQLAKTNPTSTEAEKKIFVSTAINSIKNQPTLKDRTWGALKVGSIETIKAIASHPAVSIPFHVVRGWIEAEPSIKDE